MRHVPILLSAVPFVSFVILYPDPHASNRALFKESKNLIIPMYLEYLT